jgi:nicotinate dehydrogenase subunit A
MMAAAALIWKNHRPTDEQICAALDEHLCRCGTHLRVLRAVKRSAALMWGEAE